jgi:hypothetical protein
MLHQARQRYLGGADRRRCRRRSDYRLSHTPLGLAGHDLLIVHVSEGSDPGEFQGVRVQISRRQLMGAGLGLAGAGLLGACGDSPTGFSLLQSVEGTPVSSGRSISAQYKRKLKVGSLLVAVVWRNSTRELAPTIGQISDDQNNYWRQAVEYFTGDRYGVDIWYCESAKGGNRPTVTAIGLAYPPLPGISSMNMALFEYSGASGFELCDQICQTGIVGTSVRATTNFNLSSDHELAISVIMGNMSTATAPNRWNSRLAGTTQGCFIADNLDTGGLSAGSRLTARWTGLTGGNAGAAVVATFVPKGVSGSRRLLQSSYTDSAILRAGSGHASWTSQPYPVNPTPGSTLVTFMNGSIYNPSIDCGSVVSVTDSAGGRWYKAGESGPDNHTGINIACWVCDSAVGGPTTVTATFSNASQQLACLLLELANLPPNLRVQSQSRRTFGKDIPPLSTSTPVSAGDIALAYRTSIFVLPEGPGSSGWRQIMSDTTGANALMMLSTPAGRVTASWSGTILKGGLDILLLTLRAAPSR